MPVSQFRTVGGLTFASPEARNLYTTAAKNFSPRAGFAWAPSFLKKTVFRGGFGIFYFPNNLGGTGIDQAGFTQSNPIVASLDGYLTPYATLDNPYPAGLALPSGSTLGLRTYLGQGVGYTRQDVLNAYSTRWNFTVQRELPKNTVVEIGYVGNRATHLDVGRQLNFVPRQYYSTSPVRDAATIDYLTANVPNPFAGLIPGTSLNGSSIQRQQLLRPYPHFTGVTDRMAPEGSSHFHLVDTRLEKRFSHGIQFLANYGFSKLLERRSRLNDFDTVLEKRVAGEDRTHRLVASATWDLPFGKGRPFANDTNRVIDFLIGGWGTGTMYMWQTGQPLTWGNLIYLGGDLNPDTRNVERAFDVTRFKRNSADQPSWNVRTFSSRFANLRQDGIKQVEFSVLKSMQITERLKAQFRAEFFNLLNHPLFGAPNLNPTSSAFATITSQPNQPRRTQLGLRLVW